MDFGNNTYDRMEEGDCTFMVEKYFLRFIEGISTLAETFGLFSLLRKIQRGNVIILMYHGVTAKTNSIANFDHKHVHVEKFDKQLAYIQKHYTVISLLDFIQWHQGQKQLPNNPIILTFDDGYKNCYTNVFPLLLKYDFPATIFLPSDYIGKKEIAWYDIVAYAIANTKEKQVVVSGQKYIFADDKAKKAAIAEIKAKTRIHEKRREIIEEIVNQTKCLLGPVADEDVLFLDWKDCAKMAKSTVSFGSHGVTHESFFFLSEKQKKKEVVNSKKEIEGRGYNVLSFAYPFGDGNDDILLKNAGYEAGLITVYGGNTRKTNIMQLRRICVTDLYNLPIFSLNLFVNFPLFHHFLIRIYAHLKKIFKTTCGVRQK